MKSKSQRRVRRRIYVRATAIARDIRTADFPEAVQIVAKLIGARVSQKVKRQREQARGTHHSRASHGFGLVQAEIGEIVQTDIEE